MSDTLPKLVMRNFIENNLVVVLNDGETYTDLSGCVILQVPQEVWNVPDDIDYWIKEHSSEGKPISDLLNNA